jgi:hypothetical protein
MGVTVDRDLALGHGLEQGGLGSRRGPVDLVGQDDVGEDRAGRNSNCSSWRRKTETPRMSAGSMSLVNWMRCQLPPTASDKA